MPEPVHTYIIKDFNLAEITNSFIFAHSAADILTQGRGLYDIQAQELAVDWGVFKNAHSVYGFEKVIVRQSSGEVILSCACNRPLQRLCQHQAQVLFFIMNRKDIRLFFDGGLRKDYIQKAVADYGLQDEPFPEDYFELHYADKATTIRPKQKGLLAINEATEHYLKEKLLPAPLSLPEHNRLETAKVHTIIVLTRHRYQEQVHAALYTTELTWNGKLKGSPQPVNPFDKLWNTKDESLLKFYSAMLKFQQDYVKTNATPDIEALKALAANPLGFPAYYHDESISAGISPSSLVQVFIKTTHIKPEISLRKKDHFWELTCNLVIQDRTYPFQKSDRRFSQFILLDQYFYLLTDAYLVKVLDFFRRHDYRMLVHESKYEPFKEKILAPLEQNITLHYPGIKKATRQQLEQQGFREKEERVIYLQESGNHILITPVMRYGPVEIPVLSKKQIVTEDEKGNKFTVPRNDEAEIEFIALISRQHEHFREQLELESFYLHRERFLNEDWFLNVFDTWFREGISVMGFESLKNNKLNAHKATVSVQVSSGINWFNTTLAVKFGRQKASLKQLHKAVKGKTKFVQLDDGTLGILPQEWIDKFRTYFNSGDISNEDIRIARINFASLLEVYEEQFIAPGTLQEIADYKARLSGFSGIQAVPVPPTLQATLRPYQYEGLNWLNFMDDFNFGACLADDMGLGKTVQVIAFLLAQQQKIGRNTNLIIVPTSLIFNWQAELERFAPSLKVLTLHGTKRRKSLNEFDQYEVVLTSYGTLLSDVALLKKYVFNYIVLDESQAIKNPGAQRHEAACSLQSRNKIIMTGTPVENNTFDLFGQLSFACPGLLGSKQMFRDLYAIPIDKFKNSKRARELHQKTKPFILRRTKDQVEQELPDKTEVILYCDMDEYQRNIYKEEERKIKEFISEQDEQELHKNSMQVLKGLMKLRQICNATDIWEDGKVVGQHSAKLDRLLEEIENRSVHHKILVFSQFVGMLNHIKQRLDDRHIKHAYLTGQTRDREGAVTGFKQDEDTRIFLISLKAGGTGLNLTEADYVYLVDPWWNPAAEQQAIDRSHRIGQTRHVIAARLICPGTIEEKIMKLQETKKQLVNDLIGSGNRHMEPFTRNEWLQLLS